MITPDPKYRPNPLRSVYVLGQIDQKLVERLTPAIMTMQAQNRLPITVYIDSPGGNVRCAQTIMRLLRAPDQDDKPTCRVITVVTSQAASAAADLLCSGDYAIAHPRSTILHHGVSLPGGQPLTAEATSSLAQLLRRANDTYAMDLAGKIEDRFILRFALLRAGFEGLRKESPKQTLNDLDCFRALVLRNLSPRAAKLFTTAGDRKGRYDALVRAVRARSKRSRTPKTKAEAEAILLKALVDFELKKGKDDRGWSYSSQGLVRLNDDFFLFVEHLAGSESERLGRLCKQWGDAVLSKEERAAVEGLPPEQRENAITDRMRVLLEPLWTFYVALCHVLQEGENELTPNDAFWLGLIDEVLGAKDQTTLRAIMEFTADEPPAQPAQSNAVEQHAQPTNNQGPP